MRKQLPPDALARDDRFTRVTTAERAADARPFVGFDRRIDTEFQDVGRQLLAHDRQCTT